MLSASSIVVTSAPGPLLSAASTRISLALSGIGSHRSRGIDRMDTWLVAGETCSSIVTSLRPPPTSEALPKAPAWLPSRQSRQLSPTSRTLYGGWLTATGVLELPEAVGFGSLRIGCRPATLTRWI